ncbi:MAG: acetylglutamate kinase, partial [Caulobacterales bacterium]|nr:acetylglutamate kinase [Caulobacterales bacterium]
DGQMDVLGVSPEDATPLRVWLQTRPRGGEGRLGEERRFETPPLREADPVRRAGARAAAIPMGVFEAELVDEDALGLVGTPTAARVDLIKSAAHAGAIPILTSLGATPSGQLVNVNADAAVRTLVEALEPYKIVFLTDTGGVLDGEGAPISAINLATDYEGLMAAPWLKGGMRLKVEEIKSLLDVLPLSSSVSMTRPQALAQELFTHGGAGTLVRRGERVLASDAKGELDAARIAALVEASFGRPAAPDWWAQLELTRAYVSEHYRAGAFMAALSGVAYLDKYAVAPEARGEGLGQAVWRRMRADWPRLVWRARPDNPINEFYMRECQGMVKRDGWFVFWIGLGGLEEAAPLVELVERRPETLLERAA